MATYYVFNKEGMCIATMRGATPSEEDLESREEFAVLSNDNLGVAGELMYVNGEIRKIVGIGDEGK